MLEDVFVLEPAEDAVLDVDDDVLVTVDDDVLVTVDEVVLVAPEPVDVEAALEVDPLDLPFFLSSSRSPADARPVKMDPANVAPTTPTPSRLSSAPRPIVVSPSVSFVSSS